MTTIMSFNINGVRARPHQLQAIRESVDPDVIGLQEAMEMTRREGFEFYQAINLDDRVFLFPRFLAETEPTTLKTRS